MRRAVPLLRLDAAFCEDAIKNALSRLGVVGSDLRFDDLDEIAHLFRCGAGVHCGVEVEVHLASSAGHAAQRADGRQFAALSVEVVANEDVAKEMFFEERVDSGSKELIAGRRWNFGATAQFGADFGSVFTTVQIELQSQKVLQNSRGVTEGPAPFS